MKKLVLMAAFAAFGFAVNAQTAATTTAAPAKKECTAADKADAAKTGKVCCAHAAEGTASVSTETSAAVAVKAVSKSKTKAKVACKEGSNKACCSGKKEMK